MKTKGTTRAPRRGRPLFTAASGPEAAIACRAIGLEPTGDLAWFGRVEVGTDGRVSPCGLSTGRSIVWRFLGFRAVSPETGYMAYKLQSSHALWRVGCKVVVREALDEMLKRSDAVTKAPLARRHCWSSVDIGGDEVVVTEFGSVTHHGEVIATRADMLALRRAMRLQDMVDKKIR